MELADRIKELLGTGLSGNIVASSVGCDPSYITQLMEVEEFRTDVLTLRARGAEGAIKRDGKWDQLEDQALEKIQNVMAFVTRPGDLIRIAQIANAAKRAAKELAGSNETAAPTVTLNVPAGAVIHFQMNNQSQVVEVEGRSMAPLPATKLAERMEERKQLKLAGPQLTVVDMPVAAATERRKVVSILEQIGFSEEAVAVPNVMAAG